MKKEPERIELPFDYYKHPLFRAFFKETFAIPGMQRGKDFATTETGVCSFLESAKKIGTLEPIATFFYFIVPMSKSIPPFQQVIDNYRGYLENFMAELKKNVDFEIQAADPISSNVVFRSGKVLLKVGEKFRGYKYVSRQDGYVVFERLEYEAGSLEKVVQSAHEQGLIESVILISSREPYSIKKTILPYFAYENLLKRE